MNKKLSYPLAEITQQEFADHIEDPDFFLKYGNPVLIRCESRASIVCIDYPLAVRMMGVEDKT